MFVTHRRKRQKNHLIQIEQTEVTKAHRLRNKFRCYLCGHKLIVGDKYRHLYFFQDDSVIINTVLSDGTPIPRLLVCGTCDTSNIVEKWKNRCEEAIDRFWWLF
ncbi:MAG TPA: hypothetical protein ENI23_10590 [bacterium]|nr:hypothetical protein [bacterium]